MCGSVAHAARRELGEVAAADLDLIRVEADRLVRVAHAVHAGHRARARRRRFGRRRIESGVRGRLIPAALFEVDRRAPCRLVDALDQGLVELLVHRLLVLTIERRRDDGRAQQVGRLRKDGGRAEGVRDHIFVDGVGRLPLVEVDLVGLDLGALVNGGPRERPAPEEVLLVLAAEVVRCEAEVRQRLRGMMGRASRDPKKEEGIKGWWEGSVGAEDGGRGPREERTSSRKRISMSVLGPPLTACRQRKEHAA